MAPPLKLEAIAPVHGVVSVIKKTLLKVIILKFKFNEYIT
jgi:hypothetical protein